MRILLCFLMFFSFIFASNEKKIILKSYSSKEVALKGFEELKDSLSPELLSLQKELKFDIKARSSGKNYILVFEPFENLSLAQKARDLVSKDFKNGSFINNYSVFEAEILAILPHSNSQITIKQRDKKEPIIDQNKIQKIEDILKSDENLTKEPEKTEQKQVEDNSKIEQKQETIEDKKDTTTIKQTQEANKTEIENNQSQVTQNTEDEVVLEENNINFVNYILALISLIIFLILIYFKFKNANSNKVQNSMSTIQKEEKPIQKITITRNQNSPKESDFILRLKFLFLSMHKFNTKNNNTIIFDYEDITTKNIIADAKSIISVIGDLISYTGSKVSNSLINLKITNPQKTQNDANFLIEISVNQEFENFSEINNAINNKTSDNELKVITNASQIIQTLGSTLDFIHGTNLSKFAFNLKLKLSKIAEPTTLKSNKITNYDILVYDDRAEVANLLLKQLQSIGITNSKICDTWEITHRHITDAIFFPDVVFVQYNTILNLTKEQKDELVEFAKKKSTAIVLILNNIPKNGVSKLLNLNTFYLKQPYVIDELIAILNISHEFRLDGGGERTNL